ncbi:MAG: zinc dependent phospholipase C family protein [Phycisphaerae bacterium]|nr:zinc dependent phospholipase C family protein [Phycisphaerae bacterium]
MSSSDPSAPTRAARKESSEQRDSSDAPRRRLWPILALAALAVLTLGDEVWAWGPATHVKLAGDLMSSGLLPAALASLLGRHAWHFLYGNVAADIVFAKKLSRIKQICHHWTTGFAMLDGSQSDEDRAFASGYLCHLAADTVAHGKYLPRQMAMSRSTIGFGHLYWEVRADSRIDAACWRLLRETLAQPYPGAMNLMELHLPDTLLSFDANHAVFNRLNLLASMRSWRRSIGLWGRVSRWPLSDAVLRDYHAESLARMADVLTRGAQSTVLHDDPNGNSALAHARARRKLLRRMKRARLPLEHVVSEAAACLAPAGDGAFRAYG